MLESLINANLTPQQHQAIEALSAGSSTAAAADLCGVHRNTLSQWRRSSASFRAALEGAHYERSLLVREQAESLTDSAFATIRQLLDDPKAPAAVRLRAALAIIEKTATPPAPQPEIVLTLGSPALPITKPIDPQILHEFAQQENALHEVAQSAPALAPSPTPQTYRRPDPKTGRNEPCPCGSNLKYKRCCAANAPLAAAAA